MRRSLMINVMSILAISLSLYAGGSNSFAYAQSSDKAGRTSNAACEPAEIDVATTPVPPQRGVSLKYYRELKEAVPKQTDILLIGDSIFQFWPQSSINKFTGGRNSFKFAVASDRIQSILWRMQDTDLRGINPERVVLLMGTNNLGDSSPACAVLAGTVQVLDLIYKMWPEVSVTMLEVPPREKDFTGRQAERLAFNTQIRDLKNLYPRFSTVNIDYQMTCGIIPDPIDPSGKPVSNIKDSECANFLPDFVHPAPPGYEVMGAALQPWFTNQVN